MEGNILTLLQNTATKQAPTESKWKHSMLKHDVTSNKKDFPLNETKLAKGKNVKPQQLMMTSDQRS